MIFTSLKWYQHFEEFLNIRTSLYFLAKILTVYFLMEWDKLSTITFIWQYPLFWLLIVFNGSCTYSNSTSYFDLTLIFKTYIFNSAWTCFHLRRFQCIKTRQILRSVWKCCLHIVLRCIPCKISFKQYVICTTGASAFEEEKNANFYCNKYCIIIKSLFIWIFSWHNCSWIVVL